MGNTGTIIGIGIDLCDWHRVPKFDADHPFYRMMSDGEIDYCNSRANPYKHFAACFAAREALIKALKGYQPWMAKVEVLREKGGAPILIGPIPDGLDIKMSISYEGSLSTAIILVASRNK